jgi:hypothetical protein
MTDSFQLPPSKRDFEVFFGVMIHCASTYQAAKLHNISQTRVRQIVTLVSDWVADHLPAWSEADLEKQVRLAQHIAVNRLQHQYESAMRLWTLEGDARNLRQATRITEALARLGVVPGRIEALAADVTEGPLELGDEIPIEDPHAPVRDCSGESNGAADDREPSEAELAVSDCPEQMIARERWQRLQQVQGLERMENRLLELIEGQGDCNPEKVASLQTTLGRVRQDKASWELKLSRFAPGIQIAPLEAKADAREEAAHYAKHASEQREAEPRV